MTDMSIFYLLSGEPSQYLSSHNPDPNSSMRLRKTVEIEPKKNRKQGADACPRVRVHLRNEALTQALTLTFGSDLVCDARGGK